MEMERIDHGYEPFKWDDMDNLISMDRKLGSNEAWLFHLLGFVVTDHLSIRNGEPSTVLMEEILQPLMCICLTIK